MLVVANDVVVEIIRIYQKIRNKRVRDIAQELKVPEDTYKSWLKGRVLPTGRLLQITVILNADIANSAVVVLEELARRKIGILWGHDYNREVCESRDSTRLLTRQILSQELNIRVD